jgi:hypothetical protein
MAESAKLKRWLPIGLGALLLASGWLLYRTAYPPYTPPALPTPNGYDGLLKAASLVAPDTNSNTDSSELDVQQLASLVTLNQPALALARESMRQECVVALNWSADRDWLEEVHLENESALVGLSRAFVAAARLEKQRGRPDKAVPYGLDLLQLANATSQGGLVIDRLVAGGIHYRAIHTLLELSDQLPREDCLKLLKNVRATPLVLELPEVVYQRESALFRRINGTWRNLMMTGVIRAQRQASLRQMKNSEKLHKVMNVLLQTHLALRIYQLDHRQLPEKLDQLIPQFFQQPPLDQFSGAPLRYLPKSGDYLLYSVGPNGVDDGGIATGDGETGDILLPVGKNTRSE